MLPAAKIELTHFLKILVVTMRIVNNLGPISRIGRTSRASSPLPAPSSAPLGQTSRLFASTLWPPTILKDQRKASAPRPKPPRMKKSCPRARPFFWCFEFDV